ncbi:MAG: YHS domain-containing protein [Planctomycetes bacterium]|nr:YHS domain-containing protein [Planctomycetota bacterium]
MRKHPILLLPWLLLFLALAWLGWDHGRARTGESLPEASPGVPPAAPVAVRPEADAAARDVVCGMEIRKSLSYRVSLPGQDYFFCSEDCRAEFKNQPEKWMSAGSRRQGAHAMRGLPIRIYQWGVVLVMVISFGTFEWVSWKRRPAAFAPAPSQGHPRRIDLTAWRPLRRSLQWPYLRPIAQAIAAGLFLVVVAAGLFGNQSPAMNIAPLLTWTIWWVGLVFLVLFLGKAWCFVCPWDAIATWMERLRFCSPRRSGLGLQMKWPRSLRNIWPAVGLFVLLTWVELGAGITLIPRATAYLGLMMLGLAIACVFLFERKAFCRYACLVGRVSGLYSLFSSLELRARDANTCASCRTSPCFRGNDRGDGCPTFELPRTMTLNTYCILCTECLKTCPHDNLSIRLRPWGEDLAHEGKPRTDEAFLSIILLAMTGLHGLTMTPRWPEWNEALSATWGVSPRVSFSLLMALILAAPMLLFAALAGVSSLWSAPHGMRTLFIHYAYALLPIALFYHLAHNAGHFLLEGPKAAALASDPFGWGWNLFSTARSHFGPLVSLEGLWIIQVGLVVTGHLYSLWITEKTTRRLIPDRRAAVFSQLPMLAAMVAFSVFSLWLLKQPMEMRLSAM